jgi:hypothetical protein
MKLILKYLIILPLVLFNFSCDEGTTESTSTGNLVGVWNLIGLSGTYVRDVAVPSGTDESTTYSLKVRWPYDTSDGYQADQTLKSYSMGDTLLNTTSDAGALITASMVQLVGEFKDDDTYTFVGNYPALRIDVSACSTYQTIADIDDDGNYTIAYNADETGGTLGVTPKVGTEQVLPSFPDGTVTFSGTNADTLNIVFLDRDAHDDLISLISETWVEADNRVTHGIAQAYVDATGGYFTDDDTQPLGTEGYVMSSLLATWGGYLTYNALMFNGCLIQAMGNGMDATAAQTYCGTTYPSWLANDSDHDFNATDGKLTMEIVPVCIPANETILFNATFVKQ